MRQRSEWCVRRTLGHVSQLIGERGRGRTSNNTTGRQARMKRAVDTPTYTPKGTQKSSL